MQKMREVSQTLPLLHAPNTSFGIALLKKAITTMATHLNLAYDVEIVEIHHRHKKDAPSGTAVLLAEAVQEGREASQLNRGQVTTHHRGCREEGNIGISSIRGGHLKGEHQVHFIGPHERIVLSHEAFGRELFAKGAIKAAFWLAQQKPGYYVTTDVFGLNAA
jgi:4-hydroxy-tetrahydrodipicolinate reductase